MIDNTDFRYNKSSEEIIIDLIWYSSGLKLPPGMITFGDPESFEPYPDDSIGRNTIVETKGTIKESRYFKGEQRIRYRRLKLQDLVPVEGRVFSIPTYPTTTLDILEEFNYVYGLKLSEKDVENITYEENDLIVIKASKESLVWIEEITVFDPEDQVIRVKNLSGFKKYPGAVITNNNLSGFSKYR